MAYNKVVYGTTVLVDLTGDTVTADKLLSGYTAHDKSGAAIAGSAVQDIIDSPYITVTDHTATATYPYVPITIESPYFSISDHTAIAVYPYAPMILTDPDIAVSDHTMVVTS